ncbi:hypothetical protein [Streptomyces sp. C36]|uniref:hypothetical protein n=1 Tax=Streptomyces sp. C36 TaxID=3237122 RepID=UPI0034C63D34
MFSGEVVIPVGVEATVADERAKLEDGFGSGESPAGAGDVEPVADQVPARSLDHARRDGPARGERAFVVEEGFLAGQVANADVGAISLLVRQLASGSLLSDALGNLQSTACQNAEGVGGNPVLGGGITTGVKTPRGASQIFENMNEVDIDSDAAAGGFGLDEVELMASAVDEDDPAAPVTGVPGFGLAEGRLDDRLDDRRSVGHDRSRAATSMQLSARA